MSKLKSRCSQLYPPSPKRSLQLSDNYQLKDSHSLASIECSIRTSSISQHLDTEGTPLRQPRIRVFKRHPRASTYSKSFKIIRGTPPAIIIREHILNCSSRHQTLWFSIWMTNSSVCPFLRERNSHCRETLWCSSTRITVNHDMIGLSRITASWKLTCLPLSTI